jgi:hypothetical protein
MKNTAKQTDGPQSQPEIDKISAIQDGMAIVQSVGKPKGIKNCADLAQVFVKQLDSKFSD